MRLWWLIICLLLLAPPVSQAAGGDEAINQLMNDLSTENVNRFVSQVNGELNSDLPPLNAETVRRMASGGIGTYLRDLARTVGTYFFREVVADSHILAKMLLLAVLCALLTNLSGAFEQSTVGVLAHGVGYIFLAVLALNVFNHALSAARLAMDNMTGVMYALLPLLLTLLAGVGAVTTAALLSPLMLFIVNAVAVLAKDVILPLLLLTAVLDVTGCLTVQYRLTNLTALFRQAGLFVLGAAWCLFLGVVAVQGAAGSVADGVSLRAAKFAAGTLIPVVGKMFADAVEVVMGATLLIKSVVGVFGVLLVFAVCAYPLVKILSLVVVIKLAGALVQPLGEEGIAKSLDAMGNNLLLLFGVVITTALMFFLTITMMVSAGSAAVMLR